MTNPNPSTNAEAIERERRKFQERLEAVKFAYRDELMKLQHLLTSGERRPWILHSRLSTATRAAAKLNRMIG